MIHPLIPLYDSFYNDVAFEVLQWRANTPFNPIKTHKLYLLACKLEYRFRQYHNIRGYTWRQGTKKINPRCISLAERKVD